MLSAAVVSSVVSGVHMRGGIAGNVDSAEGGAEESVEGERAACSRAVKAAARSGLRMEKKINWRFTVGGVAIRVRSCGTWPGRETERGQGGAHR